MTQELPFHDNTVGCFARHLASYPARFISALELMHPDDPKAQLRAWIVQTADRISGSHAPDHGYAKMEDDEMVRLCQSAGLSEPDIAAELLLLISDGAEAARQFESAEALSERFHRTAEATVVRFTRR